MRWPNGGPKKLYVFIINEDASIHVFDKKKLRTACIAARTPTYVDGTYTFLTYVQETK